MYRVLVTGSRTWEDYELVSRVLAGIARTELTHRPREQFTLVSGACPKGADAMAEDLAEKLGYHIERHPADWNTHGKRAGFVRNAEMVALGADVCIAFIKDGSKGATMTADLAEKAGIPTARYIT